MRILSRRSALWSLEEGVGQAGRLAHSARLKRKTGDGQALDASQGTVGRVKALKLQAMKAIATKEEIRETLKVA